MPDVESILWLTRWLVIFLYAGMAIYAGHQAYRFHDSGAISLSLFISISSAIWALFYVGITVGWLDINASIILARIAHLPVLGIFYATLNGQQQRDTLLGRLTKEH